MDESASAIQAEIARLTGAIQQAKNSNQSQQTTTFSSTSSAPYVVRGRGRGRGGGRGGRASYAGGLPTRTYKSATWVAPKAGSTPSTSAPSGSNPAPSPSTDATSVTVTSTMPTLPAIPRAGTYRNRTLIFNNGPTPSTSSSTSNPTPDKLASVSSDAKIEREVMIAGVRFVSDARGNKLVRKAVDPNSASASSLSADTSNIDSVAPSTPKRTLISGATYIRTKSGNLISLEFAKRRRDLLAKKESEATAARLDGLVGIGSGASEETAGARRGTSSRGRGSRGTRGRGKGRGGSFTRQAPKKLNKLCQFFQKTGQCNNGLTCPYIHSSTKVSICPAFLRSKCPSTSSTCLLSHSPNSNRSPHCLHFPSCTRGDACPYSHVHVSPSANVCKEFARVGWCGEGSECGMRHAFECPEFSETGECKERGCKLPHVLRRRNGGEVIKSDPEEEEGGELIWEDRKGSSKSSREAKGKGKGKRSNEESEGIEEDNLREGISGAAGRKRYKKLQEDLALNEDYVELFVALSDGEEEEVEDYEEGEDELHDESGEEEGDEEDDEEEEEEEDQDEIGGMEVDGDEHLSDSEGRRPSRSPQSPPPARAKSVFDGTLRGKVTSTISTTTPDEEEDDEEDDFEASSLLN